MMYLSGEEMDGGGIAELWSIRSRRINRQGVKVYISWITRGTHILCPLESFILPHIGPEEYTPKLPASPMRLTVVEEM